MHRPRKITAILILVIIVLLYALFTSHDSERIVYRIKESRGSATALQYPTNTTKTSAPDFLPQRLQKIQDVCKKVRIPGTVTRLYAYSPSNVTYCSTYKAASTYWIQIFRFLHNDIRRHVDRPSQISKFESHLLPMRKTQRLEYFNEREHSTVVNSFKFMMARDPYHRLWSVYVDKFVLLDLFFWTRYLLNIFAASGRPQPKLGRALPCSNISFSDMVTYVIKESEKSKENLDPHFRPMHYGCNPCIYKPDFVAKVETLTKEKAPVLKMLGLDKFDSVSDFKSHVINEMVMIIEFEYRLYISANRFRLCLSKKALEERTIQAFIINGYLAEDALQILRPTLPLGQSEFTDTVSKLFLNSSRTAQEVRMQRNRMRTEAYQRLPKHLLDKIKDLYKYDFMLYEYDPKPVNIFNSTLEES